MIIGFPLSHLLFRFIVADLLNVVFDIIWGNDEASLRRLSFILLYFVHSFFVGVTSVLVFTLTYHLPHSFDNSFTVFLGALIV